MKPEDRMDTSLVDKAIIFATKAHEGMERRGKGFPYIIHPLEAMAIVASITTDQELLAAAALHDVVEDTEYTVEDIRKEFGDRIAGLVYAESDEKFDSMSAEESWRLRKEIAIDKLKKASLDVKTVAIGDKLSNLRAIARDYYTDGDKVWNKFHCKDKTAHEWRYRKLAEALSELEGTEPHKEMLYLIECIWGRN